MAYIIGISFKVDGFHQVSDQKNVSEKRFNQELQKAIKSVYPDDDFICIRLREILAKSAQKGLLNYKSVHIAGKYFFRSKVIARYGIKN